MKKLIALFLLASTLTACSLDTSSASLEKEKITKNFEDWCKEKSTLPEETRITIEILLKIVKTQDCKKANQKLNEFTQLHIHNFKYDEIKIGDLKVLSSLTNLRELLIRKFKLENKHLKQISSLTHLTELYLSDNQIDDIKPLSGLTNLTHLYILANQISDVKPLSSLTNLTKLHLLANQISDVKPLSSLTNLTELSLVENQISDVKPLSRYTITFLFN